MPDNLNTNTIANGANGLSAYFAEQFASLTPAKVLGYATVAFEGEFEPGFIHAKCFVCDDRVATVGTVNLDYRSLYLHFECGVFLYRTSSVMDVKQDALETIAKSIPVTRDMLKPVLQKVLIQAILKLFAPLF